MDLVGRRVGARSRPSNQRQLRDLVSQWGRLWCGTVKRRRRRGDEKEQQHSPTDSDLILRLPLLRLSKAIDEPREREWGCWGNREIVDSLLSFSFSPFCLMYPRTHTQSCQSGMIVLYLLCTTVGWTVFWGRHSPANHAQLTVRKESFFLLLFSVSFFLSFTIAMNNAHLTYSGRKTSS